MRFCLSSQNCSVWRTQLNWCMAKASSFLWNSTFKSWIVPVLVCFNIFANVFSPFVDFTRSHCSQEMSVKSVSGTSTSSKQHFWHTRSIHSLFLGSHTIELTNSEILVVFNSPLLASLLTNSWTFSWSTHAQVSLSLVFGSVI